MTFRCPYTDICRAQALREFAETPDLAALFTQRLQCGERDSQKAHRCAIILGLAEQQFPTLGNYVQTQRRESDIPQRILAQKVGMTVQELRDLELNKLDPRKFSTGLIEHLALALNASAEYLKMLARFTTQAGNPRHGTVFARTILIDTNSKEQP
ncbi:helix-turn-helix transcriptional regulator [Candidatus Oscillochloris fontis]|uniref:helix-turn-helix transcriptional regulator n=1 Tax=Candidatus Oscillochloris fontis TaxID=2496868 RepID=UPI00101B5B6E|nr:helix-turn-helix transcriptional regulator [Candidatus Oscillochloris fontis]